MRQIGYCEQCGKPVYEGDAFCQECGAPVRAAGNDNGADSYGGSGSYGSGGYGGSGSGYSGAGGYGENGYSGGASGYGGNDGGTGGDSGKKPMKVIIAVVAFLAVVAIGATIFVLVKGKGKDDNSGIQIEKEETLPSAEIPETSVPVTTMASSETTGVPATKTNPVETLPAAETPGTLPAETSSQTIPALTAETSAGGTLPASDGDYLLPGSDTRYVSESELYSFTKDQCRIALNEIYARHGRKFKDSDLQNYFNSCSWYVPTIEAKDFKDSMLNSYELANIDLIVKYQKSKGYR